MDSIVLPETPEYKDRSVGLKIFGVLTALCGLGALALVALQVFTWMVARQVSPMPRVWQSMATSAVFYLGLAVALGWLGVGSFLGRRWARALLVIGAWSALVTGVILTVGYGCMLPFLLKAVHETAAKSTRPLPEGAYLAIVLVPLAIFFVLLVVLPLIWGVFYTGRNTKLTCEALDPVPRWTDHCPLPVLAISVWSGICALFLLSPITYDGVVPFFGMFQHGLVGIALCVVQAAVYAYVAWGFYKLERMAWWVAIAVTVLYALSTFLTFSHAEISQMYTLMGYPAAEAMQMQVRSGRLTFWMAWCGVITAVPYVGYLVWLRKYFFPRVG